MKAPDVLLRAAARLLCHGPERRLRVLVVGGPSGTGLGAAEPAHRPRRRTRHHRPRRLPAAAAAGDPRRGVPRVRPGRGAELQRVFGLVAIEAQACGTPVLAADVGGLGIAVRDHESGLLVQGHGTDDWACALGSLLDDPAGLRRMGHAAREHGAGFSWGHTADGLWEQLRPRARRLPPAAGRAGDRAR